MGFTFKENCPDFRNTKVIDIYRELESYQLHVDIFDPHVDIVEVRNEYSIELLESDCDIDFSLYSAIILAVSHDQFMNLKIVKNKNLVVYDVKGVLPFDNVDARL